jgi:class 3 adenylate cyclase
MARCADPPELREARDWYSVEHGEDATSREAVTSWQGDIRQMARLARDVKPRGDRRPCASASAGC